MAKILPIFGGKIMNVEIFVVDGMSSESFSTNAGVPQGSVIFPTLFLIYINDLIGQTSNPTHCYADDSTLHGKPSLPNNRNNVASSITLDLDKLLRCVQKFVRSFNRWSYERYYVLSLINLRLRWRNG